MNIHPRVAGANRSAAVVAPVAPPATSAGHLNSDVVILWCFRRRTLGDYPRPSPGADSREGGWDRYALDGAATDSGSRTVSGGGTVAYRHSGTVAQRNYSTQDSRRRWGGRLIFVHIIITVAVSPPSLPAPPPLRSVGSAGGSAPPSLPAPGRPAVPGRPGIPAVPGPGIPAVPGGGAPSVFGGWHRGSVAVSTRSAEFQREPIENVYATAGYRGSQSQRRDGNIPGAETNHHNRVNIYATTAIALRTFSRQRVGESCIRHDSRLA
eukprot:2372226-Pyramimonas_sp.AAC.1